MAGWWDAASEKPGWLAREVSLRIMGDDLEAVSQAWRAIAGLGVDAGILLSRGWEIAAPPVPVREALRMIYLWWGFPAEHRGSAPVTLPHFLTEVPLDWSRAETRDLDEIMLTAYPTVVDIQRLASLAGLDLSKISWTSTNRRVSRELLAMASRTGRLDSLVSAALDDPDAASVHTRLQSLVGR